MTKDDKAVLKMTAHYLAKAREAIDELSPDGAQELANEIAVKGLPHEADLEALSIAINKLAK